MDKKKNWYLLNMYIENYSYFIGLGEILMKTLKYILFYNFSIESLRSWILWMAMDGYGCYKMVVHVNKVVLNILA